MTKKLYIETVGCQMNVLDSELVVGSLRGHKNRHPSTIIGVLGCMAQKDQELIRRRAPHVDIVCGTGQLARLPELINEVHKTGALQMAVSLDRREASRL